MKSLANYPRLTIRISKAMIFRRHSSNGHGCRYFVRCDEIPGCCGHGATISDALEDFQKMAELWLSWFDLYPQGRKA